MNMGAAFEGFVAQELKAHGFRLRYFTSKKVGELDFVEETFDGEVFAIEVKSGKSFKAHAALDNALATKATESIAPWYLRNVIFTAMVTCCICPSLWQGFWSRNVLPALPALP